LNLKKKEFKKLKTRNLKESKEKISERLVLLLETYVSSFKALKFQKLWNF